MKKSVILVGVGGQGAILTARILINGVHFGDRIYAPVIGKGEADILVAFEKMEALRYAEFLKPDGIAVINDYGMESVVTAAGLAEYPEGCVEAMQGAFRCLGLDDIDWERVIRETVPAKSLELNLAAYRAGREAVG